MKADRLTRKARAQASGLPLLREAVVQFATAAGASPATCCDVRLAVSEALTNVVMHAYEGMRPGEVSVEAWCSGDDDLEIRIHDEGHGLIPRADSPGLGVGLGVMAQLADGFRVASREGVKGTTVSMRFTLTGERAPPNGPARSLSL